MRFATYCVALRKHDLIIVTYNYIDNYLNHIHAKGRYAIPLDELRKQFNISEKALLQNIYRLKRKNRLAQVRQGFYVIIPPRYSQIGMIPPSLFIADLMEFLNREYYVGLFSAAALHGAGHQQPMEFQVITRKPPLRNIKNKKLSIGFFTKARWGQDETTTRKTETGYINISSPEITAFDLVQYHRRIGGINRVIPVLEDLSDVIQPSLLEKTAENQKTPYIQRLGYLLDVTGKELLARSILKLLSGEEKEIPLSLLHKDRTGQVNHRWRVIVNTELE